MLINVFENPVYFTWFKNGFWLAYQHIINKFLFFSHHFCNYYHYAFSFEYVSPFRYIYFSINKPYSRGCRGCDRMIAEFTTTCTISAHRHWSCELETLSWRGVHDTLCEFFTDLWQVCFSPVSSINETDRHNITAILLPPLCISYGEREIFSYIME